ncbi:HD domain-containing protein [Planotetraspora kaengkrachanensis]|uniref:Phosphohydrolase n=1 Tax=Planotetraspora kaengkrachanensis TaxID=575193 RepID=A0A8J3PPI0_9ACTN|nr:HD domain-containing protein [Planotetraspora kaengkrachanensis]GIG77686.1 phosphohydrolase [Planotetraspora kaengkrachanensis]
MSLIALRRALTEPATPGIGPLPEDVTRLLLDLEAPPRLAAHLRAVHDTARGLVDAFGETLPRLRFDREEVLFGAATHDVGKVIHTGELSGPGHAHEQAGYELLRTHGVDARLARFARNHATWTAADISTEDLLVSLADKIWKAKRVGDLEDRVVERIRRDCGGSPWEAFMALDDVLDALARDADDRLAFQARHPITVVTGP